MGVVYRARNERLTRTEALKLITDELADDRSFRERFLREAMISVAVEHPHVIPVYDADEASGHLFIAMRYVEHGDTMAKLIARQGQLEPGLAAQLVADVASALDAAHSRDLVHRDVKPTNVLIVGGDRQPHPYLTDFGLSKRISAETMMSGSGSLVGTVDYMSPEQAMGRAVDRRTDVYALGVTLFEALSGKVPFGGADNQARVRAKVEQAAPMITRVAPGTPAAFDAVLARALARDPADRFASAEELGRAAQAAAARPSTISVRSEIGIGSVLADCRIDAVAGEGGMAIVYRATQQNLDRTVALKVMSRGIADDPAFRERFEREWKVAAAMDHRNVVPIYWAGESQGRLYIVMRYIEGGTLREVLAHRGRLEPELAVEVIEGVAAALDVAHARNLVHRDVKPGNILIEAETGRIFLTDFGLAKDVSSGDVTDVSDRLMGTARYVPPERHRGTAVDEMLGDVYSLGCVLWDMLAGSERPQLAGISGIPPDLAGVVERAMALEPGDRYGSAGEVARAARATLGRSPESAEGQLPGPRSASEIRRQPFEPAPLSRGLSQRVVGLCDTVLRQSTLEARARDEVLAVRGELSAPLRVAIHGEGAAASSLLSAILGRQLGPFPLSDSGRRIEVGYGEPEAAIVVDSDGSRRRLPLSAEGRLPHELEGGGPFDGLEITLEADTLRTLTLLLGETPGADAHLIVTPAGEVADPDAARSLLAAAGAGTPLSAMNAVLIVTGGSDLDTASLEEGLEHDVAAVVTLEEGLAEVANAGMAIGEDVSALSELARATEEARSERHVGEEELLGIESQISEADRRRLLDRCGSRGLEAAFALADSGRLTGVALRRRLREVSGIEDVERELAGFHGRADALKAGHALGRLEDLTYVWPTLEPMGDGLEGLRLEPGMHLIGLRAAYERCVHGDAEVPTELLAGLKLLLTASTPAARLGAPPAAGPEALRSTALDRFRSWKTFENNSTASPAARRIARRVALSFEYYAGEGESVTD